MLIYVLSIAPITLGKTLIVANPIIISSVLLLSGHVMKIGASLTIALVTLLTAFKTVALPTLNFSLIDLNRLIMITLSKEELYAL